MKAWIARDESGALWIYFDAPPVKLPGVMDWRCSGINLFEINRAMLPEVKWEDDEPTEVEIIIKPKKK